MQPHTLRQAGTQVGRRTAEVISRLSVIFAFPRAARPVTVARARNFACSQSPPGVLDARVHSELRPKQETQLGGRRITGYAGLRG